MTKHDDVKELDLNNVTSEDLITFDGTMPEDARFLADNVGTFITIAGLITALQIVISLGVLGLSIYSAVANNSGTGNESP